MKRNFAHSFFLVLLFLVTLTFFGLIKEYLLATFWSIVLALLFRRTQDRILNRVGDKKNLAAGLTLTGILLMVILPLFLIGYAVTTEGIDFYNQIDSGEIKVKEYLDNLRSQVPVVERFLENLNLDVDQLRSSINESLANISKTIASSIFSFTQNFIGFVIQLAIMLYVLFFFLRDGRDLVKKLVWVLPIGDEKEWALIRRFESVARATVKGSLVVAMAQGSAGGLLFFFVGIPGAVLWGVLMTIVSLLPLGSGIIWIPAAIIFFVQGEITKAIIIVLVGSLLIGLLDNFLRPRLVGNDTKMPDYLILLSTLGGLTWVGISGFVLGPIIAAFFITCWEMMGENSNQPKETEVPDR
ncbi:MAG: AI-2E family transporter [Saprospiraceae bacterium]|nr:AI-2E family transporter [Saprospiraceae bacterium]